MPKSSGEIAIELRAKFEAWLLAAAFGVLGLSVPSAKFGEYLTADVFELVGWGSLLAAGVVGLLRAEWVPVVYEIQHKMSELVSQRGQTLEQIHQRGQYYEVPFVEKHCTVILKGDAAIKRFNELLSTLETQYHDLEAKIIRHYGQMKWAFLIGLGSLVVSRGTPPVVKLAGLLHERFPALF